MSNDDEPKQTKFTETNYYNYTDSCGYNSNYNIDPNHEVEINISDQIVKMRMKLEQLRHKKKSLENENENLDCKINDLRLIITRISNEN